MELSETVYNKTTKMFSLCSLSILWKLYYDLILYSSILSD